MPLANCRRCNKLYNKVLRDLCDECIKKEEDQLTAVQHHLRQNPRCGAMEIEEATGVPASQVMKFARENKIYLSRTEDNKLRCQTCGREINAGTLCKLCQMKLISEEETQQLRKSRETGSGGSEQRSTSDEGRRTRGVGDSSLIKNKFQRK